MAYARPFGQAQGASPWSSGVPPGLQQQPNQQAMFTQPMGPFDVSNAWQGQQPGQQQWVAPMQQVQFVPNPAFVQQQPAHQQQMRQQQMHNNQRPMHQRSLSAPRVGGRGDQRRPMNQNNNYGGPQGQGWFNRQHNNNNNHNNNNQQRVNRQQSRMNNQRGPPNNNNNNNNNNNYNNQNKNQQQQQQQPKPQQQLQKKTQQGDAPQGPNGRKIVRVVKVKKQTVAALKAKLEGKDASCDQTDSAQADQSSKAQSKTAERRQLKLQARKNAESLVHSKLPVSKTTRLANDQKANDVDNDNNDTAAAVPEQPLDQAQLKCVPAVFGFVCKLCDVFLRDKAARREHIDSDEHMDKFNAFQEQEKAKQQEESEAPEIKKETQEELESEEAKVDSQAPEQVEVKPEAAEPEAMTEETEAKVE